jgi:hypothetical protein
MLQIAAVGNPTAGGLTMLPLLVIRRWGGWLALLHVLVHIMGRRWCSNDGVHRNVAFVSCMSTDMTEFGWATSTQHHGVVGWQTALAPYVALR